MGSSLGRMQITFEQLALIEEKLHDGWSHAEIQRSGIASATTVKRHFPGTQWTRTQMDDYLRMRREEKKILGDNR